MNFLHDYIEKWLENNIVSAKTKLCKILASFNNKTFEDYYFQKNTLLNEEEKAFLDNVLNRLKKGEPFTKIIGLTSFYGREFYVNHHVLDPRVDTECLIDAVLKYNAQHKFKKCLDLGTGSGCIAITLLLEMGSTEFLAIDVSKEALIVAEKNRKKFNVEKRLVLQQSSWFENISQQVFDCIVSNPPYIEKSYPLERSVLNYDPHTALFSGEDGLKDYKIILKNLGKYLKKEGLFFGEIGFNQKEAIEKIVSQFSELKFFECIKDLEGRDRVVVIQKK